MNRSPASKFIAFVILAASVIIFAISAVRLPIPVHQEKRRMLLSRMDTVRMAANSYARGHENVFPRELDVEFQKELTEAATAQHSAIPKNDWLLLKMVNNISESISLASELRPEQIVYCAVQQNNRTVDYCILAKDEKGDFVRGYESRPIIFHSQEWRGELPKR